MFSFWLTWGRWLIFLREESPTENVYLVFWCPSGYMTEFPQIGLLSLARIFDIPDPWVAGVKHSILLKLLDVIWMDWSPLFGIYAFSCLLNTVTEGPHHLKNLLPATCVLHFTPVPNQTIILDFMNRTRNLSIYEAPTYHHTPYSSCFVLKLNRNARQGFARKSHKVMSKELQNTWKYHWATW